MENKEKISQYFNSRGLSPEEALGISPEEDLELEPEKIVFWWKEKIRFFKIPSEKYENTD